MTTIEFETPARVTAVSNGSSGGAYGGSYSVQLGAITITDIDVVHDGGLSPVVYFPLGLRLDARTESLISNTVLCDHLGIDEPVEFVDPETADPDRYRR